MDSLPPPPPAITSSPLFSTEEHPESPKVPSSNWTGILISAPASVVVSGPRVAPIMVRGTYRIKGKDHPDGARWKLVVTDAASGKAVSSFLGEDDPNPVQPEPDKLRPLDEKRKALVTYVGHLNTELFGTLKTKLKPGNYVLRFELGPLRSNEVGMKLVER